MFKSQHTYVKLKSGDLDIFITCRILLHIGRQWSVTTVVNPKESTCRLSLLSEGVQIFMKREIGAWKTTDPIENMRRR